MYKIIYKAKFPMLFNMHSIFRVSFSAGVFTEYIFVNLLPKSDYLFLFPSSLYCATQVFALTSSPPCQRATFQFLQSVSLSLSGFHGLAEEQVLRGIRTKCRMRKKHACAFTLILLPVLL